MSQMSCHSDSAHPQPTHVLDSIRPADGPARAQPGEGAQQTTAPDDQPDDLPEEKNPVRSRLAGSGGRLYWRSLGQLADTEEFREYLHREFPEQASEWNDPKGRRIFLKLMSASLALAGIGACTRQPRELIVPYVRQPEEIVPGRPLYFASAIPLAGTAMPVLVESHMGRPTKIEGNPEHPASLGATDTLTQAAVLDLYDPDRAKTVTFRAAVRGWNAFVGEMQQALAAQRARGGAGLHFLTPPITSPSLADMLAGILRDHPQARWHQYDAVARPAALSAEAAQAHTIYHFDQADVVVTLDADFLSCGPGHVRYSKDFSARRRITDDNKVMNRLYAIESTPTLTGAKADHRLAVGAGEIENVARELATAIGGKMQGPAAPASVPRPDAPEIARWVAAISGDLQKHRGRSVVVAGDYQTDGVRAAARAINDALGNTGTTVEYATNIAAAGPNGTSSIAELAEAMEAGQVELLVVLGGNPVFTAPADLRFGERLGRVGLVVYLSTHVDETAPHSHWHVPEAHALESWGDARAFDGTVTLTQPLIDPLYEGRSAHEFLSVFTAQPDRRGRSIIMDFWTKAYASGEGGWTFRHPRDESFPNADAVWRTALHEGYIAGTSLAEGSPATALRTTATAAAGTAAAAGATPEVQDPGTGTGATQEGQLPPQGAGDQRSAAIPETQVPAPPTATTPGATAADQPAQPAAPDVAPPAASAGPSEPGDLEIIFRPDPTVWDGRFANNGWLQELPKPFTKVTWDPTAWISPSLASEHGLRNGDVIELGYRGHTAQMPVFIVPGHPARSVTTFFGYGRRMAGRVGDTVGDAQHFNAFLLRTSDAPWFGQGLAIRRTGRRHPLATTQEHHSMEGRAPVRAATLAEYTAHPEIIHHMGHTPPRTLTLYPEHEYTGYKWGMAIDLSSCTGCSVCTVACQAENNIPVVGKDQVLRSREMHWIRVDHYWASNGNDIDHAESHHQPIPCMQCEKAPCEVVCPVAATAHSAEGLNDMVYNRCVGTRYCSNNCPYKVRRFNFLEYADWTTVSLEGVRNPDVTVRSRGIMEKCTYCVQRINHARIDAKREDRRIRDGEIIPACAAACPSDAIVFGDMNDPASRVNQLKAQERNYGVLEDLNTRPRTTYLAEIRNPNPELAPAASEGNSTGH
jgi:MoCo/4Fe-4S cofactor protein with predicted Tat translocation signal